MYTKEEEMLLQSAIIYAVEAMKTCHNNKPVLVHSLKLANYLYKYGYDMSVVIGALFHDLVEDTDTTLDDIKQKYPNNKILIVTHNGVCRAIGAYFNGIPEDGNLSLYAHDNCQIKHYDIREQNQDIEER